MTPLILLLIPIGIVGVAIVYIIATYNNIIHTKNTVAESYSSIDTVLQNRYNLIPNLVELVKQYMGHESSIIQNVAEMRTKLMGGNQSSSERFSEENKLSHGMRGIFGLAESYPDLKASANFLELQTQWGELEDRLQGARRAYNNAVKQLNNSKEMFPSSIIANMMTLPVYSMFEAEKSARVEKIDAKTLFNG